jgi:hypothetical protein
MAVVSVVVSEKSRPLTTSYRSSIRSRPKKVPPNQEVAAAPSSRLAEGVWESKVPGAVSMREPRG